MALGHPSAVCGDVFAGEVRITAENVIAGFGDVSVLKGITLAIPSRALTAIMGPSGCGKSTFIRCINRLHEEIPGAWVGGRVILDGSDIYDRTADAVAIRRKSSNDITGISRWPTRATVGVPSSIWIATTRSGIPGSRAI